MSSCPVASPVGLDSAGTAMKCVRQGCSSLFGDVRLVLVDFKRVGLRKNEVYGD
jgi:hypothetical protein